MCWGVSKDDVLVFSSESVVLSNLQIESNDLRPGEMLIVEGAKENSYDKNISVVPYITPVQSSYCFFEWIYFGHLASVIDGESTYHVRERIGEELAKEETLKLEENGWIVVPVPESSYVAGAKYAQVTGMPFVQGLLKNHSVGRTFIDNTNRQYNISLKFTHLKEVLQGKKVILIDDSIVRGTTMKALVTNLKEWSGVKEVHLRIGCPPITSPCFYGIDFPTIKELYTGSNKPNPKDFNADSLKYLSLGGLLDAVNKKKGDLCMACITGKYPTLEGKKRWEEQNA
jgi:amidophosphoribosyltransferase